MKRNKIKTLIVEDEKAAQKALVSYLEKYCPQVDVAGTASNGKEGISMIRTLKPELVFLDVEMPYANAFDVLEACEDENFQVIFLTAYAEYAIKALNMSAAYYLLKPINIQELILAVNKVAEALNNPAHARHSQYIQENLHHASGEQLVLPTVSGFDVIPVKDVVRLRGNGNFTNVHTASGQEFMVCRFLKHFEDILPEYFIRVHKSHIVNKLRIISYHKGSGGYITMSDGMEVEVSGTYKDNLLSHFK